MQFLMKSAKKQIDHFQLTTPFDIGRLRLSARCQPIGRQFLVGLGGLRTSSGRHQRRAREAQQFLGRTRRGMKRV